MGRNLRRLCVDGLLKGLLREHGRAFALGAAVFRLLGDFFHVVPVHQGVDAVVSAEIYDVGNDHPAVDQGHVHFLAGHDAQFGGHVLIGANGLQGGIISPVIGNHHEIIAVAAVIGAHRGGILGAVRAGGVHVQIAHQGIHAPEILRHAVNAEALLPGPALLIGKGHVQKIFLLLFEGVPNAQAAVLVAAHFPGLVAAGVGILGGIAPEQRLDGQVVFLAGKPELPAARGPDGDFRRTPGPHNFGIHVVIVQIGLDHGKGHRNSLLYKYAPCRAQDVC